MVLLQLLPMLLTLVTFSLVDLSAESPPARANNTARLTMDGRVEMEEHCYVIACIASVRIVN